MSFSVFWNKVRVFFFIIQKEKPIIFFKMGGVRKTRDARIPPTQKVGDAAIFPMRKGRNCCFQREKLGTFGRVPEVYTNVYHLYMDYIQ